jgi:tetratricopeptide (TPR) repeat protein
MSDQETPKTEPVLTERQQRITKLLEEGNLAEAHNDLVAMIVEEEPVDGMYHERLVSARLLLGRVTLLMGEPQRAEQVLAPLQGMPEDDPTRPGVHLNARNLVATICRYQGRMEEAFGLLGANLDLLDQLQDPVNPDSFRCIMQMVDVARDAQQYQQAMELCGKGIERFQGKVGEAHAHLILQAGSIFLAGEQYVEARQHIESVLEQVREQTQETNELVIRGEHLLAQLEREQDDEEKARELWERCLQGLSKGGDPETIVDVQQQHLLLVIEKMSDDEALQALTNLCNLIAQVFGPRSPRLAEGLSLLGFHFRKQGKLADAKAAYGDALNILRSWRAAEDPKITILESTLAEIG